MRLLRKARYQTILWLADFFTRWADSYGSRNRQPDYFNLKDCDYCCDGCCYSLGHDHPDETDEEWLPHPEGALPGCFWPYPHDADDPDCNCCLVCHPHPVPGPHE